VKDDEHRAICRHWTVVHSGNDLRSISSGDGVVNLANAGI
jgi:hypothetical protein